MQKLKKIIIVITTLIAISGVLSAKSLAATCDLTTSPPTDSSGNPVACSCPANYAHPLDSSGQKEINVCDPIKQAVDCSSGAVDKSDPTKCQPLGNECNTGQSPTADQINQCLQHDKFITDLNDAVNFLSALVGIVVVIIIVIGGIQYSLAGDNANAQGEARKRITNAIIALLAFIFMYGFLQWLIPGGF